MNHSTIRIGILGCANIARRSIIPAIKALHGHYELVAVASRNRKKAEMFALEFGCEAITGYEHIVNRNDINALYLPLPTGLHYEWVSKAIEKGKHVYVEKSFSSTAEQANLLITAASSKNLALMEGYMFLYHRQQNLVLSMIREGKLGQLRHFIGCFGFPPLPEDNFRYDENLGGGALIDAAGYPLRAARLFCGDDLMVRAASIARDPDRGTSLWGSAYLSDNKGMGASIAFGFDNAYQCRYEIWGSKVKITAERAYTPGPDFAPDVIVESAEGTSVIKVEPDNHFIGALREFYQLTQDAVQRRSHYRQILHQSQALDDIGRLASQNQ